VWTLAILLISAAAFLLWHQSRWGIKVVRSTVLEDAVAYSEAIASFRSLYTSEVVERLRPHGVEVTHEYRTREGAIPLPATLSMELLRSVSEPATVHSRLYSPYPFPWRSEEGGLRDDFSREAWDALSLNPDEPYYRFQDVDGLASLRYATSDLMRASCVDCHNSHEQTPKSDWQEGDLRGVLEIVLPMDIAEASSRAAFRESVFLYVVLGLVGLLALGLVIGRLRKTSERLEHQVALRTRDLEDTNVELERAQQDRDEVIGELTLKNAELESFTHTVSHDLKSPLITISGFAGTLEQNAVDGNIDVLRSDVSRIQRAAVRMKELLDDLLELSRVGRVANAKEEVDLDDLVNEAVEQCSGRIAEREVEVVVEPGAPTVVGDRTRLLEVLQNLIDNAVKFTREEDRPRIWVTWETRDDMALIHLRDNGIGLDPRYAERVFELFEQLDPDREGTGLGLAVVKRIVEVHGGRVSFSSKGPGCGATVTLTLPLCKSPTQPKETAACP
jgi:signal transduction histidine kinase